jgi:hypothetical protein
VLGATLPNEEHVDRLIQPGDREEEALLALSRHEPADATHDRHRVPGWWSRTEGIDVDSGAHERDVATGESAHVARGVSADREQHIGFAQTSPDCAADAGKGCGEGDLRAVAEDPVGDAEFRPEPGSEERERVWGTEKDDIGREGARLGLDPSGGPAGGPHEPRVRADDAGFVVGRGVDRRQDQDLVGIGGDEVPEVLLDATGFRRIVVRYEQQAHV